MRMSVSWSMGWYVCMWVVAPPKTDEMSPSVLDRIIYIHCTHSLHACVSTAAWPERPAPMRRPLLASAWCPEAVGTSRKCPWALLIPFSVCFLLPVFCPMLAITNLNTNKYTHMHTHMHERTRMNFVHNACLVFASTWIRAHKLTD